MFITRMGILSLGEIGANSMFDILKQMSDYGGTGQGDQEHPDPGGQMAHEPPGGGPHHRSSESKPHLGGLPRSHGLLREAGQPIDVFMRSELDTIAEQYNVLYDTRLESVDTLKEIYVSLVSAGLFGLVVAGIHLVLFQTGSIDDPPAVVASRAPLRHLRVLPLHHLPDRLLHRLPVDGAR